MRKATPFNLTLNAIEHVTLALMKHLGTSVAAVYYGAEQFVDHAYSLHKRLLT